MITPIFWIIPVASILALVFAWFFFRQMMKESEGTELMAKIARHVRKGAMSYLKQQYKVVASVFLALVVLFSIMAYGFGVQNEWVPIAFLTGGFFSGLAGFLGMCRNGAGRRRPRFAGHFVLVHIIKHLHTGRSDGCHT